jgi:dTMP kinase
MNIELATGRVRPSADKRLLDPPAPLKPSSSANSLFDIQSRLSDNLIVMPRLPFITFEGTEGCGKSTQVRRLAARLESLGNPFIHTREPGGTAIGETVRELLQFAPHGKGMFAETELLLFEASRSQLVREIIKPALDIGICVISDRFFDSTTAYQGAARQLSAPMVDQLNGFAVGDCVPDLTIVLDVDARTAQTRLKRPRRPDRMEQEPAEFYERVRKAYRELAKREPNRVKLVDGTKSEDEIESTIWELVKSRFPIHPIVCQSGSDQSVVRNPKS